jgi:hypothetical protein
LGNPQNNAIRSFPINVWPEEDADATPYITIDSAFSYCVHVSQRHLWHCISSCIFVLFGHSFLTPHSLCNRVRVLLISQFNTALRG